ncbi:hypothetical protein [Cognataquiflexum rubidum]|jgi:hypothetical protein|uniref:hypothetical protein n=1 Tax=Cognataquiflexum rubidum TaxID=2922273 RepID=UPI001F13D41D|nr:hypothetical protein [Cognataquiflexum rubidum]MCH6234774.1 hypothetical protein [Cognataquiflexum rubidum]
MKAIEIKAKTDKNGNLLISEKLHFSNKEVRVLILVEDEDIDEKSWLKALSKNPSFDFLSEPEEDIYTTKHGKPFHD